MTDHILDKLTLLPDYPGVYIMKDASGEVIYVGYAPQPITEPPTPDAPVDERDL